jgi:murein DD-endopeptidase MepM/ murein hydrolase activator NlpD
MMIFIASIAGAVFVSFSPMFERELPQIKMENNGFWNLKAPLHVSIDDASGIQSYKVTLISQKEKVVLIQERLSFTEKEVSFNVEAPKRIVSFKPEEVSIIVEANDASKWNFFMGNSVQVKYTMQVDMKSPRLSTLTNSMYIHKGGSGLVIFKADDPNLSELYIDTNYKKRFKPQPFYKEGYYISLVAWKLTEPSFKAQIVAKDSAGNVRKTTIPFRNTNRKYRISKIKLSDRFLDGKIAELAETFEISEETQDRLEQFKIINEDVRAKNEKLIHDMTSVVHDEQVDSMAIKPFYPLKNGQKVASFGDHRYYYYKGKKVSESYHLGLDLASVKMGEILTKNAGKVIYSDFNGLYGNMPAIDHGLGLYSIYGHCSSTKVQSGDEVKAGEQIANTGMSGYAMGDHLHFGILVQGVEVRPEEWMDYKWIKLNIISTIKDAKKIIDRQ